jgi:hypothetical protein
MSISISQAKEMYGGTTEAQTLRNMAEQGGYCRIYKYANDYGDRKTHTDYKRVKSPNGAEEADFFNSPYVHNHVLVYDNGKVLNLEPSPKPNSPSSKPHSRRPTGKSNVKATVARMKRNRRARVGHAAQTDWGHPRWKAALAFVKQARAAGQSDEQIIEAFRKSGWTETALRQLGLSEGRDR